VAAEGGAPTVRLLGPVQFVGPDGTVSDLPSASQRRLLAMLALHAPRSVRSSFLCQVLDITPGALRTSIARMRRHVGEDVLRTTVGGYRLAADVDAALACAEIENAAAHPDRLSKALERWRGPALEEFRDEAWAVGDANRLDDVRADAIEDLAELRLTGGEAERAIQDLDAHVAEHPLRDRAQGLRMRALASCGRQAEALRVFQSHREYLAEVVGLEPGDGLCEIEQRVAAGWRGIDDTVVGHDRRRHSGDRRAAVLDDAIRSTAIGVGRRSSIDVLTTAAERTADEGAGVVLISGEVGIGKTTLLADFARRVADRRGWDVYYGRCDELVVAPFQPLDLIVGRIVDELPDEERHGHAARHGGDIVRLLPGHAARIPAAPVAAGDDRTVRHLLFDAVADVVSRAARRGPTVVAIDDLQWAEPTVVHLLRHVVQHVGPSPVLFVPIIRDTADGVSDHVREALADWARGRMDRIVLDGLDRDDLEELVRVRIPATAERDVDAVADALHEQTAGNGLLADHLLEHWDRSGRLVFADTAVRVSNPVDFFVPARLRDLVWHRISALGDGASATLTAAATLGNEFDERVLAAMPGTDPASLPPLLDRAVNAGVLVDNPSTPHSLWFTHALVAQALESDLRPRERRRLHAASFTALLASGAASVPDLAPHLAHHARMGGLEDDALRWAIQAGDIALADLAPDEAVRWFETSLEGAAALGRSDEVRADLLVRLGEARTLAGAPDAIDTIVEGATLAMATGAPATLVRAALAIDRGTIKVGQPARRQLDILEAALDASTDADIATRARLTALVAERLVRTDETDRRITTAREALELARSADRRVFAEVAAHVLQALWAPGTASVRAALAREAVAAVRDVEDPDLVAVVHFAAYGAAVCAGEAADAAASLERIHDVAAELRDPQMGWAIGLLDAFVATMEGSFAEAERIVAETTDLGVRIGVEEAIGAFAAQSFALGTFAGRHAELLPFIEQGVASAATGEMAFRIAHAIVCCEVGRPEVAAELLHAAMRGEVEPTADDFVRSTELIGFAVLALELDDVAAAEWLHPQVVPLAGEVSFNSITSQGPIAAYAGKLASLVGDTAQAERFLLAALATAEAFGWQYHRATTLLALAQNRFRAAGRLDDEGMAWLAAAEELCGAHGIVGWAKRAAGLRGRLPA
jgi:DNA-binding SARP family transcriptional activator